MVKTKNIVITNISFLPKASNSDNGYKNKIGEKIINNQKKLVLILDNVKKKIRKYKE